MSKDLVENADICYQFAEKRAKKYFESLNEQLSQKTFSATITKDLQSWKQKHIHHHSIFSFFNSRKGSSSSQGYYPYIKWLDYTGKLDNYLNRSIMYIFMRDLGRALHAKETKTRIQNVVEGLKKYLVDSTTADKGIAEPFSLPGLYRIAQKEHIESTMIWLLEKLANVSNNIPKGMDAEQAKRKLIKIIAGVIMHEVEEMDEGISAEERAKRLDEAIRLGYSYGLTYPFIDDLLDAQILSAKEEKQYADLIRTTLITGSVPELGNWAHENKDLIQYIHSELREAFDYIKSHQRPDTIHLFFEQAYVFFQSQEVDRNKDLSNPNYTNEELYIPVILKSSSSRLIARTLISAPLDEGFNNRTFFYGIYNQLADDFADMFDDLKDGSVTPYTYYMKYHKERPDLINPFALYWTVVANLIHHVYQSDRLAREVILNRAINGLKRFKEKMGTKKYNEVMDLFFSGYPKFNQLVQKMVRKADDVDFFDKLLRDHMMTTLKKNEKEKEDFINTVETVRIQINRILKIKEHNKSALLNQPIIDAANYSLEGDGKRLRPIMTWVMAVNAYGLKSSAILPVLKSLEYMHTASLIFDDLPSHDNASIRRGRKTVHQVYNVATAELTGLFLTQKATEEQANLDQNQFDAKTVLRLISYSAKKTQDMCKGQAIDLGSKGKQLTLDQLNMMSFYKTGIGFEAALIMPAILAQAKELEIEALKRFAYHTGIAFQIKDDLLDVEGIEDLLGKSVGNDAKNNSSTFVTVLGIQEAKKAMWDHYCSAVEALQDVPRNTTFLKQILNYIVNRDH
ncbi:polyprenyl synthetase family protein [Salirhabdus euzebyi]|nr:polyprenyl synthetase family protein [Salirhabdus euzebyi]